MDNLILRKKPAVAAEAAEGRDTVSTMEGGAPLSPQYYGVGKGFGKNVDGKNLVDESPIIHPAGFSTTGILAMVLGGMLGLTVLVSFGYQWYKNRDSKFRKPTSSFLSHQSKKFKRKTWPWEKRPTMSLYETTQQSTRTEISSTSSGRSTSMSAATGKPDSFRRISVRSHKRISDSEEEEQENGEVSLGTVRYQVHYDIDRRLLQVTIVKAVDLPEKEEETGYKTYIRIVVKPDCINSAKTRMISSRSPVFNESFEFYEIKKEDLERSSLQLLVFSVDRFSQDNITGEILLPLTEVGPGQMKDLCKEILPRSSRLHPEERKSSGKAEILLSFCYQPTACRVMIVVLKARNLPAMDINGLADPYVKIHMTINGEKICKRKTTVKKRTLNPVYNESFSFNIAPNCDPATLDFAVHVVDWDRVTKNDEIGVVNVGANVEDECRQHWKEVIGNPRKQIAKWHPIN